MSDDDPVRIQFDNLTKYDVVDLEALRQLSVGKRFVVSYFTDYSPLDFLEQIEEE